MTRVGDNEAGFSVGLDASMRSLVVVAWGFWNAEVAAAFGSTVLEACPLGVTRVVFDMGELKPMRDEGQRSWGTLMSTLSSSRHVTAIVVGTSSQLTKLQLLRIARQFSGPHIGKVQWVEAGSTEMEAT